jgi:hypothetical protein
MSIRTSVLALPGAIVAAGVVSLACSSSATGLTAKVLRGSYVLTGYNQIFPGGAEDGWPPQSGSLTLTTTTYKAFAIVDTGANVNIPDTAVSDTGTYRVQAPLLIQTSARGAVDTATVTLSTDKDTLTLLFQGKARFQWTRQQ